MKTIYLIILKDYDFDNYQAISIASQLAAIDYCDVCIVSSVKFQQAEKENFKKIWNSGFPQSNHNFSFTYFEDHYFHSLSGYNDLLKSKHFYQQFAEYDLMAVSQADVYLLRPEMLANPQSLIMEYDYLGAPWFFFVRDTPSLVHLNIWSKKYFRSFRKLKEKLFSLPLQMLFKLKLSKKPLHINHTLKAGNGGFSIRRINSFLKYFELVENKKIKNAEQFSIGANLSIESNINAEDIFWAMLVPKVFPQFKVAKPADAIFVCWESGSLQKLLRLTRCQYPCAVHGWWKWNLKDVVLKDHALQMAADPKLKISTNQLI